MASSTLGIFIVSILVSSGLWLSMRAVGLADTQPLVQRMPVRLRRRVQWCQGNAMRVQVLCALVAVSALGVQLSSTVS